MARPSSPLITRDGVVEIALEILRTEGIGALNLRRIAQELGVNAASIYHHFANKDEILRVTARAAIDEVEETPYDGDIRAFVIGVSMAHYRYFVANPWLIPLLAQGYAPRQETSVFQSMHTNLRAAGVSAARIELLMEAVENLVNGGALLVSARRNRQMQDGNGQRRRQNGESRGSSRERHFAEILACCSSTPASMRARTTRHPADRAVEGALKPRRPVGLPRQTRDVL